LRSRVVRGSVRPLGEPDEGVCAVKRFNIAIPRDDGGVAIYPMKEWLRQHPDQVPKNLSADHSNSHQLRAGLCKNGWEARESDDQVLLIKPGSQSAAAIEQILGEPSDPGQQPDEGQDELLFPLESHLRDFISRNLETLPIAQRRLKLYVDPNGRNGVEYPTAVGPIDILAIDGDGNFVVFELKLSRGADSTVGQISRYMGWVKKTLAQGKSVSGIIVANAMDEKVKYAALIVPDITLLEYEIDFRLRPVQIE